MEKNVRMFFGNVVLEKKMEWRGSVKGLIPEITEFAKSHGAIVPEDGPVVEDDLESGLLQATWQSVYLDRGAVNEDRTITVLSQSDPKKEGPVSKKEDNSNKEKQEPQKKEPEVQIKIDEQPKKVENVPEKQDVIIEIKDPIEKKDPEPELGPSALQLMRQNIEHVVILMLENRGLDTVLGWLYEDEDPDKIVGASTDDRDYFDALGHLRAEEKGNFFDDLKPAVYRTGNPVELSEKNQKINKTFYVRKGAQFPHSPFIYPHEDHEHITLQVFGEEFAKQQGSPTLDEVKIAGKYPAPMNGFAKDYLSNVLSRHEPAKKSAQVQAKCIQDLFDVYTPDQLPVLNGLARFELEAGLGLEPYMTADVRRIQEPAPDAQVSELGRTLRERTRKVLELIPDLPRETASILDNVREPGALADLIASNFPEEHANIQRRQDILEAFDLEKRVQLVLLEDR